MGKPHSACTLAGGNPHFVEISPAGRPATAAYKIDGEQVFFPSASQ
jgi:hypothetical protein